MKNFFLLFSCILCFSTAFSQSVTPGDLEKLTGNWTGELTYLDYTSNKPETIDATLSISSKGKGTVKFAYGYPGEKGRNSKETFRLSDDGKMINGLQVIERSQSPEGNLKIVFEEKGRDGNDHKPATFQHLVEFSGNRLTITKMVRFDGEADFFQRNQYNLTR